MRLHIEFVIQIKWVVQIYCAANLEILFKKNGEGEGGRECAFFFKEEMIVDYIKKLIIMKLFPAGF